MGQPNRLRLALIWVVIVLIAVPVAGAVGLGILHGDSPCILCWAQRTSMTLIALVGLFVVRYGPKPRYLGIAVLLGAWGVFMALRHSGLHLARDIGQGFSAPILGVHTYAWSWFIHWVVLGVIGVLLLVLRGRDREEWENDLSGTGTFAMGFFMVVVAANAVQAFASTGPPPFIGQADPVRFSLNPSHWVWEARELEGRLSLRGSWTVSHPNPAAADPDPTHGPIPDLPSFSPSSWERLDAPLDGSLSGFARDSASGRYLAVTDLFGVYVLDSTLTHVVHHATLDKGFSIDLTPLVGATFVGADTLAVISDNKSYVLLTPDPDADADRQWRRFLTTDGGVTELRRSRFATVRARQMYIHSLAFDPAANEFITVSVPNPRHRDLVVSRFARADMTLSSEFEPVLGDGLALGENRGLAEYVVTGATVMDGTLWAISAAYATLLAVDLRSKTVHAAYAVPGLGHPVGLAARGSQLLIAQTDGRVAVLDLPPP